MQDCVESSSVCNDGGKDYNAEMNYSANPEIDITQRDI